MATKRMIFDGAAFAATGFALSFSRPHAITTLAGTLAAANQPRYASQAKPICDVPSPITLITDGTAANMVFGGKWTDGTTDCLVFWNDKSSPNASTVSIYVDPTIATNSLATPPSSRTLNIRCTGADLGGLKNTKLDLLRTSVDEESDYVYAPYGGFTIVQGVIIAQCSVEKYHTAGTAATATVTTAVDTSAGATSITLRVASGTATLVAGDTFTIAGQSTVYVVTAPATLNTTGVAVSVSPTIQTAVDGDPSPKTVTVAATGWQARSTGFCYWDEVNSRWRKLLRGRDCQIAAGRGREWLTAQYWPLDGLPLAQSREVALVYADYKFNPLSDGGQVFMTRLSRATASAAWSIGTMVLLFEETGVLPNCHYHNAFAYRDGANGVTVVLLKGDGSQGECLAVHRSDSAAYASGWDGSTPLCSVSDLATQNGWTTYRQVSGSPAVLNNTPAVGWAQPMGVARYFEGGPRDFLLGNDEGLNSVYIGHFPEFSAGGETKAWYEPCAHVPLSAPSIRRGWLAFGVWSEDPSEGGAYAAKVKRNSSAQASVGATSQIPVSWSPASGAFLQGFSAGVADQNTRVLYSVDGTTWASWFSPNADVRPAWCKGHFLTGGIASYGKVLAWPKPAAVPHRKPIITSPCSTQRLISTLTQAEAPSANQTFTAVDPAAFGVPNGIVDGRTIPPPPCNGPVRRWTVSGATSKYGGVYRVTSDTSLAAARNVSVRMWVYLLPPSDPFNDPQIPPFNGARANFRVQLLVSGTGQASYLAVGDCDSVDASGWVPLTIVSNTSDWLSAVSGSQNLALRLTDSSSGQTNMDVLLALDTVQIEPGADALCAHPGPVGASSTAAPGTIDSDFCSVGGLNVGAAWTITTVQMIPDTAWDQYMPAANLPANAPFFTLWQSNTRKITARPDLANRRIVVTDGTNSVNLTAASGYEWVFDRGVPIVLSIAVNGTALEISGSVGGTPASTATLTLSQTVRPSDVVLADAAVAPVLAMETVAVVVDDAQALNASARLALMSDMRSLLTRPSQSAGQRIIGFGF